MHTKRNLTALLTLLVLAAACVGVGPPSGGTGSQDASPTDTPESTEPEPTELPGYPLATAPAPAPGYPAPDEQACEPESPDTQRHELTASDGVELVGTFYPPADCQAPLVILYHQFGWDRTSWTDLALWMQNRGDERAAASGLLAAPAAQYAWFPPLPSDLSFAVFTVDFRDHGESAAVEGTFEVTNFLLDAQAAFDYAKTLPNVDPERIITMGASIGADASADVCLNLDGAEILEDQVNKYCIGSMPLSPGSFLDVPYTEVVTRLGQEPFDVHIHCVAAELDGDSPALCRADVPGDHTSTIYPDRNEHGIALIAQGFDPDIGEVIHDFLLAALGRED